MFNVQSSKDKKFNVQSSKDKNSHIQLVNANTLGKK